MSIRRGLKPLPIERPPLFIAYKCAALASLGGGILALSLCSRNPDADSARTPPPSNAIINEQFIVPPTSNNP